MSAIHSILVGAPSDVANGGTRPTILQRSESDFINATLDDLRTAASRAQLGTLLAQARDSAGRLKLFQPIQRQFHVALIESWCDTPGSPRIDPQRVDAAGMVLRRVGADGQPEGWMKSRGRVRGWTPVARIGGGDADPASAQRLLLGLTGVADIDQQLTALATANDDSLLSEGVIPMYIAPPDVCADAAKTLFYGVVPTVSSEISEAAPVFDSPGVDFGPQSANFQNHLVQALRGQQMDLPSPGDAASADWLAQSDKAGADPTLARFVTLLRQLASEFNAFDGGADVARLQQALQAIALPLVLQPGQAIADTVPAFEFLSQAADVVLGIDSNVAAPTMPATWPALSSSDAAALAGALHDAMQARFVAIKGKQGRFDEPSALYQLRAFVRLKADGACPARVVWTDYTDPFTIAAWYEGAGAPPVQILLPDPSDRDLLKALKPNVSFVVPPSLQSLLAGSAKDQLAGTLSNSSLGLTWICSFNIPIITICAFLVLNIFLSLFNIVFGWLFFMKICLPFPKIPPK